jgi:hypothetical protein
MGTVTKALGNPTKYLEKVISLVQTVTITPGTFSKTKCTATEFPFNPTGIPTKASGPTVCETAQAPTNGTTAINISANGRKIKDRD